MKAVNAILSAAGLLVLALSIPSWAQTRTLPTQTITLSGTVETIDHDKRVVNIKTPGEPPVNTATGTSTAGQGERPGGTASEERTMTATISAIDKSASSISFTGPNGWKYERRVVDPTVLDKLKVGDQVDITWDTNVTVSVQ